MFLVGSLLKRKIWVPTSNQRQTCHWWYIVASSQQTWMIPCHLIVLQLSSTLECWNETPCSGCTWVAIPLSRKLQTKAIGNQNWWNSATPFQGCAMVPWQKQSESTFDERATSRTNLALMITCNHKELCKKGSINTNIKHVFWTASKLLQDKASPSQVENCYNNGIG